MTTEAYLPNVTPPLYELSAEQIELRDQAAKYFVAELRPLQQRMDDEDWWPDEAFRGLGDMGYLGQTIPEEYGGAGLDYLTSVAAATALPVIRPARRGRAYQTT